MLFLRENFKYIRTMSLKAFKDIISRSFEREDVETVNGLHSKLKDRLSELLAVATSSTNDTSR